jgi:tetratricopeptide (TPR) repeat protein
MKKQVIVALALGVSLIGFAQKKEVKAFEKLVNKEVYTQAKAMIPTLEPMLGSMDESMKAKYYLNKAKALYSGGKILPQDIDIALESLSKAEPERKNEVGQLRKVIEQDVLQTSNAAYTSGNYAVAAKGFATLYKINPSDQTYLYYAAETQVSAKDYDAALEHYIQLKANGYTGEEMQYFAIDKLSDENVLMSKSDRDRAVKIGTHIKPTQKMSESKEADIVKKIALIYIQKGENEKALEAISEARTKNPNDANLVISEANINLQLGNKEKAGKLFKEAAEKDPNNIDLIYNIGVIAMENDNIEEAESFFNKVLSKDQSYAKAAQNLSTLKINKGNVLNEKMNALGTSNADFKKYDEYKAQKQLYFKGGAEVLENFVEKNPNTKSIDLLTQLKNIYSAIGESNKSKAIKAKIDALGTN